MTPETFRTRLQALGLTTQGFAALVGIDRTTVAYWGRARSGRGVQEFPAWVGLLLTAWEANPACSPPQSHQLPAAQSS